MSDPSRGARLRELRIAWNRTQEEVLPGGRVSIGHAERGQNKVTSARLVQAYTTLVGCSPETLRAYVDGRESLAWIVSRATNRPPRGWESRVAESASKTKSDLSPGPPPGQFALVASHVLEGDMPLSAVVQRAARAAAELEGVSYETAEKAAYTVIPTCPRELVDRADFIDQWCRMIRQQIPLIRSGVFPAAKSG